MQPEESHQLTQLEEENARLQPKASPKEEKLLATAELEPTMLELQASAKQ